MSRPATTCQVEFARRLSFLSQPHHHCLLTTPDIIQLSANSTSRILRFLYYTRSSAMNLHSRLPVELSETVIDNLQDDKATLFLCNLVCRSWSYRCRHHSLRTITLFQDVPGRGLKDFIEFLTEVQDKGREHLFSSYVSELRVVGSANGTGELAVASRPTINAHNIASVLTRFSRLRSLTLSRLQFANCPETKRSLIPGPFKLEKVEISACGTPTSSLEDIVGVLELFGEVGRMNLISMDCALAFADKATIDTELSRIRIPSYLNVRDLFIWESTELLVQLFSRTQTVNTLRNLTMSCRSWDEIADLETLIPRTNTVTQLALILHGDFVAEDRLDLLQLVRCTSLKIIFWLETYESADLRMVLGAICNILFSVSSTLDGAVLYFADPLSLDLFLEHADAVDWKWLEEILLGLGVMLAFTLESTPEDEILSRVRKLIKTEVSNLDKKGLVHVECMDQ